jgi:hypothetical protein
MLDGMGNTCPKGEGRGEENILKPDAGERNGDQRGNQY